MRQKDLPKYLLAIALVEGLLEALWDGAVAGTVTGIVIGVFLFACYLLVAKKRKQFYTRIQQGFTESPLYDTGATIMFSRWWAYNGRFYQMPDGIILVMCDRKKNPIEFISKKQVEWLQPYRSMLYLKLSDGRCYHLLLDELPEDIPILKEFWGERMLVPRAVKLDW